MLGPSQATQSSKHRLLETIYRNAVLLSTSRFTPTRIRPKKDRRTWIARATVVARRRCLRIFHLIVENPQARISYNCYNHIIGETEVKGKIFSEGKMYSPTLGLDIESNSVGSAWIDLKNKRIKMGDSVFPAGVEDSDVKRGAPKNQARRGYRSQTRITKRRAERKHRIQKFLLAKGWMPREKELEAKWLEQSNPWMLRKEGLERELTKYEFGRVLLHLSQRRGAYGFDVDEEEDDAGKIKDAISETRKAMKQNKARTFGVLMAAKFEERSQRVGSKGKAVRMPIRNRTKASGEGTYDFCADREMIWEEFDKLWEGQKKNEHGADVPQGYRSG